MRDLQRNCQTIYYSLYVGKTYQVDKNGYRTGERIPSYSKPVMAEVPVSARTGKTDEEYFGKDLNYDRMILTTQKLPIDEYSRLYIEAKPDFGNYADGENADYRVKKVSPFLNQHAYALEKIGGKSNG